MPTVAELLSQAQACHRAGRLPEAVEFYEQALRADSANSEAHYLLGITFHGLGQSNEAIRSLSQAIRLDPDRAEAHNYLGAVLGRQGKLDEAILSFQQAQLLSPESAEISGNLKHALAVRDNNRGNALAAQGKRDEAVSCYRRALQLKPDYAEAHHNLGTVSAEQDQLEEAVGCHRRALALRPDFAEAHNNLGAALVRQEKLDEAVACFRRALELKPDYFKAHNNLGAVLAKQNKPAEAAACCRRALELRPDFAEAHNTLGMVLETQGDWDEAMACWRRALELRPDYAEASSNLGKQLSQLGRIAEAEECYLNALALHPRQDVWKLNILSLCPSVFGNNADIEHYRRTLLDGLDGFGNTELSFSLPALEPIREPSASPRRFADRFLVTAACTPSFNLQFHGRDDRPIREAYARLFRNCFPAEMPASSSGRPRIGFVVTDSHEDAFLKSMAGVLMHMDSDLFELVVMGSDRGIEVLRPVFRGRAIELLGVPNTFDRFVEAIRAARLDLLYYWEVGTDNINYFLPFFRLAPVQCTSWGIQVTSGISQLDYYLSSALVEPHDACSHYTENLVLASTLLTYRQRVSVPDLPKPREYFGIAPGRHLYLCAQQLGKFQPDFDPILAGILRADPEGVAVVVEDRRGAYIANQLRQRFAATISDVANRIVFLPFQPTADYLSLVAAADVLLDPLHFGGVNSSYDGFSLNKPIVTLPSRFQRGRYTLACYRKMEVSDCVASDPEQYIDIAVTLGKDAEYRSRIVEKIRRASPVLFDDIEAVREHERIFSALVERARSTHRLNRV